jgi:hypothetical protein
MLSADDIRESFSAKGEKRAPVYAELKPAKSGL